MKQWWNELRADPGLIVATIWVLLIALFVFTVVGAFLYGGNVDEKLSLYTPGP